VNWPFNSASEILLLTYLFAYSEMAVAEL